MREQRELQELLDKLNRDKKIRQNAIMHHLSLTMKTHATGKIKKKQKTSPNYISGSTQKFADDTHKESSILPVINGKAVGKPNEEDDKAEEEEVNEEDVEEVEPPKVMMTNGGVNYEHLQRHIYYNQRKIGDPYPSRKMESDDINDVCPTGYVIENGTVQTTENIVAPGNNTKIKASWRDKSRSSPLEYHPLGSPSHGMEETQDEIDVFDYKIQTDNMMPNNDTRNYEEISKGEEIERSFSLPKVFIRRFPDDSDPDVFGVSMRMALQSSNHITPMDRPSTDKSRQASTSSGVSVPSLPPITESNKSEPNSNNNRYGLTMKSLQVPKKPTREDLRSSLPALPTSQSLVQSRYVRKQSRVDSKCVNKISTDSDQSIGIFVKGTKRKPLRLSNLPITLRYSKSTHPEPSPREHNMLVAVYKHRKALDERIAKFLSSDFNSDYINKN